MDKQKIVFGPKSPSRPKSPHFTVVRYLRAQKLDCPQTLYCSKKKNYPPRFHRRIILMTPALGVNATSTMLNFIIKGKAK